MRFRVWAEKRDQGQWVNQSPVTAFDSADPDPDIEGLFREMGLMAHTPFNPDGVVVRLVLQTSPTPGEWVDCHAYGPYVCDESDIDLYIDVVKGVLEAKPEE